ncbi:DUF968 domain-containing protein [Entomohabitans teleogrylli]|uniref:DUF968 domain-containing protein n=1 Tax=Entomohabitans teleogrylli TaxID=1384589 RepID=UPI00073D7D5D|nr:DUF968 domain-containing protein [Entomohabitans teleogrylli]
MRALLTPVVVRELGLVMLRPGADLLPLFSGRVLIDREPEYMTEIPSGELPPARQRLQDDESLTLFFADERVIHAAGGLSGLDSWLLGQAGGCQWAHSDYHHAELVACRHAPGSLRLCWHCDNTLRHQHLPRLEQLAQQNVTTWLLDVARSDLGFDESHGMTLPELCWWAARKGVIEAMPEGMARKALRMPASVVHSVTRESNIVPELPATSIVHEKVKKVLALKVDPDSPESFMLRPKRRRWECKKYTDWVKAQPCSGCGSPADDPHHLIGHGQGGMGTKAHDLFVLPLCRVCHDELHADMAGFERKHGSQLELLFRFIDRAMAIGVLA